MTNKVRRRDDEYVERWSTDIWLEEGSKDNPYLTEDAYCHGYNFVELINKRNFSDIVYLLFKGELPDPPASELFSKLMVACISPGPRSPSARTAVMAGVGKTDPELILPAALTVLSGANGAAGIYPAMQYFASNISKSTESVVSEINNSVSDLGRFPPGFGQLFGGSDPLVYKIGDALAACSAANEFIPWVLSVGRGIPDGGLLMTGLFAAALCDLDFPAKAASGVFQLCNAPGLWAHGLEFCGQPMTSVPFLNDDDYIIES